MDLRGKAAWRVTEPTHASDQLLYPAQESAVGDKVVYGNSCRSPHTSNHSQRVVVDGCSEVVPGPAKARNHSPQKTKHRQHSMLVVAFDYKSCFDVHILLARWTSTRCQDIRTTTVGKSFAPQSNQVLLNREHRRNFEATSNLVGAQHTKGKLGCLLPTLVAPSCSFSDPFSLSSLFLAILVELSWLRLDHLRPRFSCFK